MTVLHLAATGKCSAELVQVLIEAGADVNAVNSDQRSPLHYASMWNPAVVPVLIGGGCKVNLLDRWQCSPLFYAACSKVRSTVLALLQAGADPHLGESPLTCYYVSEKMKALVKSLLK